MCYDKNLRGSEKEVRKEFEEVIREYSSMGMFCFFCI